MKHHSLDGIVSFQKKNFSDKNFISDNSLMFIIDNMFSPREKGLLGKI